ncbi:MAG: aldehyde dehydrogenase [Alistipes sp.]|jgi:hypothetical protein|nr:aldehyde dehydrogenase [Alistipes sp.]
MSNTTDIFTELGRRMAAFDGLSDSAHRDVGQAARNLAADMLSREGLDRWLADYPWAPIAEPSNVLIVTAGNIPFVGLQDLICTLAAGHRAIVKPSSKDYENMSWVVGQLKDISPQLPVTLTTNFQFSIFNFQLDAVLAMGGDEAVSAIGERYAGVPMLLRGHRSSLAVLEGTESAPELDALAADVLTYSGLGCRDVSLVFVPRGYDLSSLASALSQREGLVDDRFRNNRRQARALMRMTATPHIDCGTCLLTEQRDFPNNPTTLNCTFYDSPKEVTEWIEQHDHDIQCVATNFQFSIFNFQLNRVVKLGATQRPTLADYPDGRDTMQFLKSV